MADFKLPKLKTLDRIVDQLGRPSISFVSFFGMFSRAIEVQEAAQDGILQEIIEINDVQAFEIARLDAAIEDILAAQAAAEAAQADADTAVVLATDASDDAADALQAVDGLADGTTPFTGLNVAGDDKVTFLNKVASDVIDTDALAAQSITDTDTDYTSGTISGLTTSPVVLATVTVTTGATDRVDLLGNFSIATFGSGGSLGTSRASPQLQLREGATVLTTRAPTTTIDDLAITASPSIAWSHVPGAGTWTYTMVSLLSSTTSVGLVDISQRYLQAVVVKR